MNPDNRDTDLGLIELVDGLFRTLTQLNMMTFSIVLKSLSSKRFEVSDSP